MSCTCTQTCHQPYKLSRCLPVYLSFLLHSFLSACCQPVNLPASLSVANRRTSTLAGRETSKQVRLFTHQHAHMISCSLVSILFARPLARLLDWLHASTPVILAACLADSPRLSACLIDSMHSFLHACLCLKLSQLPMLQISQNACTRLHVHVPFQRYIVFVFSPFCLNVHTTHPHVRPKHGRSQASIQLICKFGKMSLELYERLIM